MKTQIILRIIFIIIALFAFTNNDGSFTNARTESASIQSTNNNASEAGSKTENKNTQRDNNNSKKEIPSPFIPDTHHDHDFDCFDFRHHEKRLFWKCIANKTFAFLYHLTVLCAIIAEALIH